MSNIPHSHNRKCLCHIFFLKRFYLSMRHTHRGRDTGRWRSRRHAGSPTWDLIPGLQDHIPCAEGGAKPLSHPGCPLMSYLNREYGEWFFSSGTFFSSVHPEISLLPQSDVILLVDLQIKSLHLSLIGWCLVPFKD